MHATDDGLDFYVLGMLTPRDRDTMEEHLLVCEFCRLSLTEVEERIGLLRQVLREMEARKREALRKAGGGKLLMFKSLPS